MLALLAPLFAVMITLGDLWADQIALDHVAASAVRRAAAQGGDSKQLRGAVAADLAAAGLPADSVSVQVDPARPAWQEPVTVRLNFPREIAVPLLGSWSLQLSSEFSARNEVGEVSP